MPSMNLLLGLARRLRRNWLRLSLLAFASLALWFGWQAHIVKERNDFLKYIVSSGGFYGEEVDPPRIRAIGFPWYRRIFGDRPIAWIEFCSECPADDLGATTHARFPEAWSIRVRKAPFFVAI
jgi:hypothetical protein